MPVEAHDWSEADTRRYKIDALLAEAGWTGREEGHDIEYEVQGMPSGSGSAMSTTCSGAPMACRWRW